MEGEVYMAKHMARKEKRKLKSRIITIILSIFIIGALVLAFLLYGPYAGFREYLITVGMTSMTHDWIPKLFYSDETIAKVMENNRVDEVQEDTNTWQIKKEENTNTQEKQYANESEKQILAPNLDKDKYNIYKDDKDYILIGKTSNNLITINDTLIKIDDIYDIKEK